MPAEFAAEEKTTTEMRKASVGSRAIGSITRSSGRSPRMVCRISVFLSVILSTFALDETGAAKSPEPGALASHSAHQNRLRRALSTTSGMSMCAAARAPLSTPEAAVA